MLTRIGVCPSVRTRSNIDVTSIVKFSSNLGWSEIFKYCLIHIKCRSSRRQCVYRLLKCISYGTPSVATHAKINIA